MLAFEVVPLVLLVAVPLSVHAGFFSNIVAFLQKDAIAYQEDDTVEHIEDVPMLSATTNADPKGALGGGDVIVDEGALVSGGTLGEDETNGTKAFAGEISVYVVREGDTLSQIAEMFEVNANTILWANDLKSFTDIHPGDTLVILPIVGVRHVVKSGDTLASIAKKYDAELEEILTYNHLDEDDELTEGQTVVVPGGTIATAVHIASAQSGSSGGGTGGNWLTHPVPGAVKTQGIHGYNGVDLAASYGTPIRAAASGEVIVAKSGGWNGGYGSYIVIRHANGVQTLYAHLSSVSVGIGAYVSAGEVIGAMGNSGRSTGTHLHFEVRGARNPF